MARGVRSGLHGIAAARRAISQNFSFELVQASGALPVYVLWILRHLSIVYSGEGFSPQANRETTTSIRAIHVSSVLGGKTWVIEPQLVPDFLSRHS